ncbi:MAG: transglutaminase domain-containing protein [Anaerolineae bacterium]
MAFDVRPYQGLSQFGPAYRYMLERDSHAPGSVDHVLVQRMVRLAPQTALYLYDEYSPTEVLYSRGARPSLERRADEVTANCLTQAQRVGAIARFCAGLAKEANDDLDHMIIGGTEEEIITRGSDWCTDVARVGCVLCQLAGIPARIANLFDTGAAYSGHAIIEAYRGGVWGAVDTSTSIVYRYEDGAPATCWDLVNHPGLIDAFRNDPIAFYSRPEQFRGVAIANYPLCEWQSFDYTPSGISDYCRSILEMSEKGWPGELRWLHGENGDGGSN